MDLRKKRKMELENQKNQRKEEVVSAALEVFKRQGIENTKMTDIAEHAQIGVASVYRYFKTKPDLAIEVACKFWEIEISELTRRFDENFQKKTGIVKVEEILNVFLALFQNHRDFIKFLYEFDNFVVREKISKERLKAYEKNIINLKPLLIDALDSGKTDSTIRADIISDHFYFTITHTLMSLCQKLTLRGDVLESDEYVDGEVQLKMIIDMAVKYLKN